MTDCIYSAYCVESQCDTACPIYVQTSYLLERNSIDMNSNVFQADRESIQKSLDILEKASGRQVTVCSKNTVDTAELLTYCAICQNWYGSKLHCNVYNFKFSKYLDLLKQSWSIGESDELKYMRVFSNSSKILIISNIDYVSFNDFESQTILNLLQSRLNNNQTTIIVSPYTNLLVGKGLFFTRLQKILSEGVIK